MEAHAFAPGALLSVVGVATRKCSECTTSGTLSELRPPVEIAAAAALCPFKLEYIWYAFEPRIHRGFERPSAEGVQVGQRAALYPLPGAQETGRDNCGERPRWVDSRRLRFASPVMPMLGKRTFTHRR